jgi:hypothetical protein
MVMNVDLPTDVLPVRTCCTEFSRLRTFIAIGLNYPYCPDIGSLKRQYQIAGRNLSHKFIERVSSSVGVAFR